MYCLVGLLFEEVGALLFLSYPSFFMCPIGSILLFLLKSCVIGSIPLRSFRHFPHPVPLPAFSLYSGAFSGICSRRLFVFRGYGGKRVCLLPLGENIVNTGLSSKYWVKVCG